MSTTQKANLFIISGPSGAGKNSVVRGVLNLLPQATRMITSTTRKPRPGERNGVDYYFLTEGEFKKRIKQNRFLEWAKVHDDYYGTAKEVFEKLKKKYNIIIMAIDVQGAESIRKLKIPHISIFITAESKQKLISRIKKRKGGMPKDKLKIRLESAIKEMKEAKKYGWRVINKENQLDKAVERVYNIIQKELSC